jgi:hypothetical protein
MSITAWVAVSEDRLLPVAPTDVELYDPTSPFR